MHNHFVMLTTLFVGGGVDHSMENVEWYNITFPAGVTCSSFNIPIKDDKKSEGDEQFTITIMEESLPYGVTLGENTTATATIIDNDSELVIYICNLFNGHILHKP